MNAPERIFAALYLEGKLAHATKYFTLLVGTYQKNLALTNAKELKNAWQQ